MCCARLVVFFYAAAAVAVFRTFYPAIPIFLRGARFDELQDVNERGADAKNRKSGAWWLHQSVFAFQVFV